MNTRSRVAKLCVVVSVTASIAMAVPQDAAAQAVEPEPIDARSREVLDAMSRFIDGLDQFSFTARVQYDRTAQSGQLVEVHEQHDVAVQRPGRLRATVLGEEGVRAVLLNDGTLTVVDPLTQQYFQADAPGTVEDAVDVMVVDLGLSLPNADFLYTNSAAILTADATSSEYLGVVLFDGGPCHHLAFARPGLSWQVWVAAGTHPTPRRISLHYVDQPGAPRFAATLDWQLTEIAYDRSAFAFIPDDAMRPVQTINDLSRARGEEP